MNDFITDTGDSHYCCHDRPKSPFWVRQLSLRSLDQAMRKHMAYIVHSERRPFSYLDFLHFNVDGKTYGIKHGTFRNKVSKLRKLGIVELYCNSVPAFYTIRGESIRMKKTMTPLMTPNHTEVTTVTSVIDSIFYNTMQDLPSEQKALHDIHLKFQVTDIWKIVSLSGKYKINPINKDIALPPLVVAANSLKVRTTIHRTDTVTVVVACSNAPIVISESDIVRLHTALARSEERLSRIVDECGQSIEGGYESIPVPDYNGWTVTLWHVGTDSSNYKEYLQDHHCTTWQDPNRNVLYREYIKKNLRPGQNTSRRKEIQEYPEKTLAKAIEEKLSAGGYKTL
jgi:hypothetical protein